MADINANVDVGRPVKTVYNQWTQFEDFPRFMEGVEEVRQLDDATLVWKAQIAGVSRTWKARIVEQEPDRSIAWTSIEGVRNNGRVTFEPLGPETTRVRLALDIDPVGFLESVGEGLGLVERRAEGDLERFREFVESRPAETGSWRGEIDNGSIDKDAPRSPVEAPAEVDPEGANSPRMGDVKDR